MEFVSKAERLDSGRIAKEDGERVGVEPASNVVLFRPQMLVRETYLYVLHVLCKHVIGGSQSVRIGEK